MRLEGRRAIITGAASGMGAATAELFVREGAHVLAVDLPGSGVASRFEASPLVQAIEKDITDDGAADVIVGGCVAAFGGLDILVNNAGIGAAAAAESMHVDAWDRVFAVDLRAMFLLCQRAIPEMRAGSYGRIVNISSVAALRPDFGLVAYSAAKAGVLGLTRTLALELGRFGITANAILPGPIYTGMTRQAFDQESVRAAWEKKTAVRRLGEPEDIANGCLFLALAESSFVTGHGLVIDGGQTLRM